jgi:hypothetical protein
MAVLIEAMSVVGRLHRTLSLFGSWQRFVALVPNRTLCCDNEIWRVGFMHPEDAMHFIGTLIRYGFTWSEKKPSDLALINQMEGFVNPCDWAEYGHINLAPDRRVAACILFGSQSKQFFSPEGWSYKGSLSEDSFHVPEEAAKSLGPLIRTENGYDVYRDPETGKEVFLGRTRREQSH